MRNILTTRKTKFICTLLCCAVFVSLLLPFLGDFKVKADEEKNMIMVSLGDSFSSGEGIEPFYGQDLSAYSKVRSQDWLAHRSKSSWSGMLKLPGVEGTMSENRSDNWFFVATSGAETKHLKKSFEKKYDTDGYSGSRYIDPQLNVFKNLGGEKADYVTLTLGGNDAKFTDVISEAVKASTVGILNPSSLSDKLNAIWDDFYKEDGIRDNLQQAYTDIANAAGAQAKIIVAGYPKLLNKDGKGMLFTKDAATTVNDSVSRFNAEIEMLVNSAKSSGLKICFVSVEEEFDGHEAYSKDTYINKVEIFKQAEDLEEGGFISAYSMHPNKKGAEAYAKCVQAKINSIEKDGGKSEWPQMTGSKERDIVLVLDASGSMEGTPMAETKSASEKFINTVLKEEASIGVVAYDNSALRISEFCKSEEYLKNAVNNINAGGGTNIEAGLTEAYNMLKDSNAKKKIIVLMSDGSPNNGKVGEELIKFADDIKDEDIYIYTLGFFSGLHDKADAQSLMQGIANEGAHYEVDDAEQLVFFFGDIADQIKGTKYIYIRIACPVDVTVKYGGEKLSSKNAESNQRTEFGTLTFEENTEENKTSTDNRIKILRLKEGAEYDINIEGNGKGRMTYIIGFMDSDGEYSDMRKFTNIKINKRTEIDTVAANSKTTTLKVDEDGDGSYDYTYKAAANERGELVDYTYLIYIGIAVIAIAIVVVVIWVVTAKKKKNKNKDKVDAQVQFCQFCGKPKDPNDVFCSNCGAQDSQNSQKSQD